MERKTASGILTILLLVGMLTFSARVQLVKGAELEVPKQYSTIQATIDAAKEGDTIKVAPGTYGENLVVDKSVSIVGEKKETTIIDGSGTDNVIHMKAGGTVSGFTIRNAPKLDGKSGILVENHPVIINDNIIENNGVGVQLKQGSDGSKISNNVLTDNGQGVRAEKSGNHDINDNTIKGSTFGGIVLIDSDKNGIFGNKLTENKMAGVALIRGSNHNTITGNTITHSPKGIHLDEESQLNTIQRNYFDSNEHGAKLEEGSSNNTIRSNIVTNNLCGICLNSSNSNVIYHNNFINNTIQVYSHNSTNMWDKGYPSGGNYWSDYLGEDMYSGPYQNETGSDGIWDHPYVIDENNKDNYPLVRPYDPIPEPWIIEPSILNPEAPRHNDTIVIWGDFINVSAVELNYAEDIENTTFEYSSNGVDWSVIGMSFEGIKEWENWTDIDGNPFNGFEVWSVAWNTSVINEGLYHIRATMVDTAGQIGQDNITVYFDRTPPIPRFTLPWGVAVNGTIQISVETNATDILYTQFESLKVSTEYDVPVVRVPDASCVWNDMASLLLFWANQKTKTGEQPLRKLIQKKVGDNWVDITDPAELIAEIATEYGKKVWPGNPLTWEDNGRILAKWLENRGFKGWVEGVNRFPGRLLFKDIKKEFEEGPVIVGIWDKKNIPHDGREVH